MFLSDIFTSNSKLTTEKLIIKKTVIAFFFFALFIAGSIWTWKSLRHTKDGSAARAKVPELLKKGLVQNEKVFDGLVSDKHIAPNYAKSDAVKNARVNGNVGLGNNFDTAAWNMVVLKSNGDTLRLKLSDIQKLPKTEIVFNFKCIEGWSQITWWGGAKFSDFVRAYGLQNEAGMKYLGLSTPDNKYYVGIDMPSAMHPQTLLCYELNGKPLPLNQGYPLRLIIPLKYGVKSLKRIGSMYFNNARPKDYWAEKGYDYFIGL